MLLNIKKRILLRIYAFAYKEAHFLKVIYKTAIFTALAVKEPFLYSF